MGGDPLGSLDRSMMQDIGLGAWLAPKYTQYTPDVQSLRASFSGPLACQRERGTQPGKTEHLRLGRALISSLLTGKSRLPNFDKFSEPALSRTCWLHWVSESFWRSGSSSLSLMRLARIFWRRRVAVAGMALAGA